MDYEDMLVHFGIKGMKWGVKKAPKPEASADSKAVSKSKELVKRGGTAALSTKDLQEMITRMNLEKQYRTLKAEQPSRFAKGHAIIKEILGVAKTAQQVHQLLNSPLTKDFRNGMKNAGSKTKAPKAEKASKEGPVKGTLTIQRELD